MSRVHLARFAATILVAATFASCSVLEPRPDLTRFFVLSATTPTAPMQPDASPSVLGVGPVTLPTYLMRPELVRRASAHEIEPSRIERWAEPLESATMRVLAEDLALTSGRGVVQYPWRPSAVPSVQIEVEVLRFEPVDGKRVELVANVTLVRSADKVTSRRRERIEVALAGAEGDGVASAMSAALFELATRVAAAAAAPGASR